MKVLGNSIKWEREVVTLWVTPFTEIPMVVDIFVKYGYLNEKLTPCAMVIFSELNNPQLFKPANLRDFASQAAMAIYNKFFMGLFGQRKGLDTIFPTRILWVESRLENKRETLVEWKFDFQKGVSYVLPGSSNPVTTIMAGRRENQLFTTHEQLERVMGLPWESMVKG